MKKWLTPLIGLTTATAVAATVMGFALSGGSGSPISFPQGQLETETGERVAMEALLWGELVKVDGYLRVKGSDGVTSHLLIWPPDFMLNTEEDAIQILNGAGQVVARVGDELRVSRGAVSEYTGLPSPDQSPGPYWIVGDEVGPAEATEDPVPSVDDIDPNKCNWVHNITACDDDELDGSPNGEDTLDRKDSNSPASSAVCAEGVPDCNDTLVIGTDDEGTIEPAFGGDGPSMADGGVKCGPDEGTAITSDAEVSVSCLNPAPDSGGGQDTVGPDRPPVIGPGQ